jgi:hypothetical protein
MGAATLSVLYGLVLAISPRTAIKQKPQQPDWQDAKELQNAPNSSPEANLPKLNFDIFRRIRSL